MPGSTSAKSSANLLARAQARRLPRLRELVYRLDLGRKPHDARVMPSQRPDSPAPTRPRPPRRICGGGNSRRPGAIVGTRQRGNYLQWEAIMLILGIILLVVGFVTGISILWTIGIILVVIGAILWILGSVGHAVAGRRHYW